MKKLFTILGVTMASLFNAQSFNLTSDNFKSTSDNTKDYIVIESEGKSELELFTNVKMYITSSYKGIKNDGYNEVPTKQIVIDLNEETGSKTKIMGMHLGVYEINNRYEINFKDGRIMIKPTFRKLVVNSGKERSEIYLTGGNFMQKSIFNKKGEVSAKEMYQAINTAANTFIDKIKNNLDNEKSSDW